MKWKCKYCHGTGERIIAGKIIRCAACDGTGNAFVDGSAETHKRELERIRRETWDTTPLIHPGRPYDGAFVDDDGVLRLP